MNTQNLGARVFDFLTKERHVNRLVDKAITGTAKAVELTGYAIMLNLIAGDPLYLWLEKPEFGKEYNIICKDSAQEQKSKSDFLYLKDVKGEQ